MGTLILTLILLQQPADWSMRSGYVSLAALASADMVLTGAALAEQSLGRWEEAVAQLQRTLQVDHGEGGVRRRATATCVHRPRISRIGRAYSTKPTGPTPAAVIAYTPP